ncbi:HD domain-containing phosphohydrolase [Deinococcus yavapaiensis]|uniref:PAS domain S-box-containing protein n=1 Tax=Deinococcus yavapaiensis KR-236 TaxID=694435 RepID=A0A318S221_9DEIO|nr:HD domain-containing phosphohydrolase [Deinococcus yavapaiensis]PYE50534.1 PAS domain S-box-containing protein [Deinococcus yavapaiensis KR-236]
MPAIEHHPLTPEQLLDLQRHVTSLLVASNASHDVVSLILDHVRVALSAHSASVDLQDADRSVLHRVAAIGYTSEALQGWRDVPLTSGAPITDAVLERRAIYLTATQWDAQYPHLAGVRLPSMQSVAALPLVASGHAQGVITFAWDRERVISGGERAFLEAVASQCAQALERLTLHESQMRRARHLRKLLKFSADITLVLDNTARVTYLSPSVTQLLGYHPADLVALSLPDVLHPDDLPGLEDQFTRAILTPDVALRAVARVRHKHGGWVWMEVVGRNLLGDEDVRGFVCNARDVTTSFQAIKALRDSERTARSHATRYQRLLDLITAVDAHADEDALIVTVLERGLAVMDYNQAFYHDVEGTTIRQRFARGEDLDEALAVLPATMNLHELGASGRALLRHEVYFAAANVPIMNPPEPLPRRFWRAFCTFPVLVGGELRGAFTFVSSHGNEVHDDYKQLMRSLAGHLSALFERHAHLRMLDVAREETLRTIGVTLEYRDLESKGHTNRVVALALRLGQALGLTGPELDALRWGAYLHDTGKIATPDEILLKPGPLDAQEWEVMRRHPLVGYQMLSRIPLLPPTTLAVVMHHHEHWDGGGYPSRLHGEDIPFAARIFAVVDAFDALTSKRPYKLAWSHEAALTELEREAGRHFDPDVVRVFVQVMQDDDRRHDLEA